MKEYVFDDFENNWMNLPKYEYKALRYAEQYGIIEYTVKGTTMTYYEQYPNEGIFKAIVKLTTMKETRKKIKFIRSKKND